MTYHRRKLDMLHDVLFDGWSRDRSVWLRSTTNQV
jgi:hypothetical protein